uniref:Uncharacterized protein n=1 Tax=Anguilla anguilla TaxID=7936 RepID=A0A0E9U008_ANGAN
MSQEVLSRDSSTERGGVVSGPQACHHCLPSTGRVHLTSSQITHKPSQHQFHTGF